MARDGVSGHTLSAPSRGAGVRSEVADAADFSQIRYAQVWEDADILLDALDIQPGDFCVSIASAGDNALAMLTRSPARVLALDLNPAQLACLELRVAAWRRLEHTQLLELIGSRACASREALYGRCRDLLSQNAREFWDARRDEIARGIGGAGKFERYFALFRRVVLPLIHSRAKVAQLLAPGRNEREREEFYRREWNTWRWRLLFKVFFSRWMMGQLGRDPRFFRYVEGSVASRILERTRHALTKLDPAENPYLQWILMGEHTTALPVYLREENFEPIRVNLDRLEWQRQSIEEFLAQGCERAVDRFNLSDIFEYMSEANYHALLEKLIAASRPGTRLAYWNMLASRHRLQSLAGSLRPLSALAARLHARDQAFFYNAFVIEEVR